MTNARSNGGGGRTLVLMGLLAVLAVGAGLFAAFASHSAQASGVTLKVERVGGAAVAVWSPYAGDDFSHYQLVACEAANFHGSGPSCGNPVYKSGAIWNRSATALTVSGISADKGYGFILQVWRTGGSALKIPATLAAPTPPKQPGKPPPPDPAPTLTATRSEDGASATLTWTAYTGSGFKYYQAVVCEDSQYDGSSCRTTVWKSGAIYGQDSTGPLTVPNLDASTGYGVILQTWRTGGALKSRAELPGDGPSINAPSNLTVTASGGNLTVSWDAVDGATGYDVESDTNLTGDGWQAVHSNTTSTSVTVADDANDRIERVRVRARNADGEGAWAEISRGPSSDWLNVVIQSGASSQSAQAQSQLAAPASITVTRDNARDQKLHVSWAAVTGASGYNLSCSVSPGWNAPGGSDWWHCGSTTSATSLTVDNGKSGGDLVAKRSYLVAVRAVTSTPADASDWKRSEDIRPVFGELRNLTYSRSAGSITLSWRPHFWTTGYEIHCDEYTSGQAATYTRCATLTDQDDTAAEHSVTIRSWTAGGTDYTIDDTKTYDIKIVSTNTWGRNEMLAPLIHPSMVSNLASTKSGDSNISDDSKQAVAFSTGPNSGGYVLKSVTVPLKHKVNRTGLTLTLHEMEGSGQYSSSSAPSSTVLATLSGPEPTSSAWTDIVYTCSGNGCNLSSGKTYFVVAVGDDDTAFAWAYAATETETALPSDNGWSIGYGHYKSGTRAWGSYSDYNIAEIVFATVPSLTASSVTATGATLTIGGYSGAWYYKSTTTGQTTCTSAGSVTSVSLTLTAVTSYTFSAYSDSACTTANLLATAAQFTTPTPTLTASSVTATGATLTIAHHVGAWYYKHTNTGATCDGPVAAGTSTKALTSLTAGASYTYSAYSDSTCTTGNLLATASSFTTPVTVSTLGGTLYQRYEVGNYLDTQQQGAQAFTTGSHTGGYTLSSIDIRVNSKVGSPTNIEVTLHAASGSNPNTGTTLATLSGPTSPSSGTHTYTCSGAGCNLSAGTTYFVLMAAPSSPATSYYYVDLTRTAETTQPSGNGWSIADRGRDGQFGNWFPMQGAVKMRVTAVPVPSVSNLGATSDGLGAEVYSSARLATAFTTGGNSGGYTLTSVTAKFRAPTGTPGALTVAVHASSSGAPAATATHTLSGSSPSGAGESTFTCSGGCSLSANTTYFVVLTGTGSSSGNHFSWDTTASGAQTNTPDDFGWSIADTAMRHFNNAWTAQSGWAGIFKVSAAPN